MRPLRLELEGFTSFRERLAIDFSGLDLFALTGPTGAGKSSLIDAMVFALYGQVPRVGDEYKQLMSHGAERMSVLFEFAAGKERYRIARVARRSGASQQRLEQLGAAGPVSLADKVKEIRAAVERIVGLDYEGFTRSVVLPQGQFDSFLKGEPKERRKILVSLLNLGVFDRMQQIANRRATEARSEGDFVKRQLATDFAGVSAQAVEECRSVAEAAQARAAQAMAELRRLDGLAERARSLRASRRSLADLAHAAQAESAAVAAASGTLAGAENRRVALGERLEETRKAIDDAGNPAARLAILAAAAPHAAQLVRVGPILERLVSAVAQCESAVVRAATGLQQAQAALSEMEAAFAEARAQEAAAREALVAVHRAHSAASLRRDLREGEPCPVCLRTVDGGLVAPLETAPELEGAERIAGEAREAAREALESLERHRGSLGRLEAELEGRRRELAGLEEQRAENRSLAAIARQELVRLGSLEIETLDPRTLAERIGTERKSVDAAGSRLATLERERAAFERELSGLDAEVAVARARGEAASERLAGLRLRRAEIEAQIGAEREALVSEATGLGLDGGRDEADAVEALRLAAESLQADAAAEAVRANERVAQMERAVTRVAALETRREALEGHFALHKTLGDLLRANELVAFIQEEALRRLADEGSAHLGRLSNGRYALRLGAGETDGLSRAEQDFFVVDRWNGDAVRSVRTLSGGETFLASLALALALAESLASLSAGPGEALESLFLDEGFGTLDGETLEVVVSALDALHGGQRMVGLVTHVRELAERLPARLEVRRQGAASTAVVV